MVLTVKKDGSIKLALDAKALNIVVKKNKYQMDNIDDLVDRVAEIISS